MTAPVTWSLPTEMQTGTHAARPAVSAVGEGALYSCSTHQLVYQMLAGAWGTWYTPPSSGAGTVTTVEEVDGSPTDSAVTKIVFPNGTLAISSHVATYTPAASGVTASYIGYNTVGGTEESATLNRVYAKKVTPGSTLILQAIEIYARETTDSLQILNVAVYEDNAGAFGKVIASNVSPLVAFTNNATFGGGTASVARWWGVPLTATLTGSTSYWLGWQWTTTAGNSPTPRQFYDGSGTDRRFDSGGIFLPDGGRYTETTDSRKYSVRGLAIA